MTEQKYRCKECGAEFDNEAALDQHNHTVHSPYKCDVCGHTFQSESELKTHTRIAHPEETSVR